MLAIRLQRNGRSGYPVYRIIVQEANRHPLSGRIVAQVGSYNPHTKETVLEKEQVEKFLSNGAQPSGRVVRILKEQKVKLPKWVKEAPKKNAKAKNSDKLRKNQPKEAPAEKVAEKVEEPAEEKAEEAVAEKAEEVTAEATEAPEATATEK